MFSQNSSTSHGEAPNHQASIDPKVEMILAIVDYCSSIQDINSSPPTRVSPFNPSDNFLSQNPSSSVIQNLHTSQLIVPQPLYSNVTELATQNLAFPSAINAKEWVSHWMKANAVVYLQNHLTRSTHQQKDLRALQQNKAGSSFLAPLAKPEVSQGTPTDQSQLNK